MSSVLTLSVHGASAECEKPQITSVGYGYAKVLGDAQEKRLKAFDSANKNGQLRPISTAPQSCKLRLPFPDFLEWRACSVSPAEAVK